MYKFQPVHVLWLKTYIFLKIILTDIARMIVIATAQTIVYCKYMDYFIRVL